MALVNGDNMAWVNEELSKEQLVQAQTHIWNHILAFTKSMSLKSAVDLGIPDIIHNHGKPMKLSELVDALPIHKSKSHYIHRVMRILVHSEFFLKVDVPDETKEEKQEEERYWLTPASRLLLQGANFTVAPIVQLILDPILTKPWNHISEWLENEHPPTPVETAHGRKLFELVGPEFRLGHLFQEAMSSDTRLVAYLLASDCRHAFEGIESLVDVGGGMGTMAKAIVDAFPHMKCTVLDLPSVVAGLEGNKNLTYVGGDMFEAIPSADAVFLKWILHDWNDEDCGKILKQCKDAITDDNGKGGIRKVIIVDMIMNVHEGDDKVKEDQLFFDMAMMAYLNGKERSEEEWAKLLLDDAGFTSYKITPAFGVRSLIEVYP